MLELPTAVRDTLTSKHAADPAPIDWLLVLKRLFAFARRRLMFHAVIHPDDDLAIKGLGDGTDQIAIEVWEEAYSGRLPLPKAGKIDTDEAVRFLIFHVRRHFLDRARRQRDGETVMVWDTEASLDEKAARFISRDVGALSRAEWAELRRWLKTAAAADPLVRRYLDLQYGEDGFMGFTRSEAAERLGVKPADITNVQKKIQRILKSRGGR